MFVYTAQNIAIKTRELPHPLTPPPPAGSPGTLETLHDMTHIERDNFVTVVVLA